MKKVIIVGAGKKGIEILNILGTGYVECFADNSKEKQESGLAGKRVIPVSELRYICQDYILVVSPIKYQSILEQLQEIGCSEYIVMSNPIVSHISKEEIIKTLYTPTMIKKRGEYYFIIDCWHHRIIYSTDLNMPIDRWQILDDRLQNPHSIDAFGECYVVDNSDANEIVLYVNKGNKFVRTSKLSILGRPHKVIYSRLWNAYLVLMSERTSIAMVIVENEKLHLLRTIEWNTAKGYSRSIKIVEDKLFIVSSFGIIYCINEKDIFTSDLVEYSIHPSLYGMSDIEYWNERWFISNYTDEKGNRNPIIAYSRSLEELCYGNYETVQIESGIPYFFEVIDKKLFITSIDTASNISVINQNQSDFNLELIYSNKEISEYDLYKRFYVEHINDYEDIGKVCIKYDYYGGKDKYSDGPIEDEILDACVNDKIDELFERSDRWEIFYHFCDLRRNLLNWINVDKSAEVLEIGAGMGALTAVLSEKFKHVDCIELSRKRSLINAYRNKKCDNVTIYVGNYQDIEPALPQYDCITLIGVLEYSALYLDSEKPFIRMLELARKHLKDDGKLIIAIENKIGLKYLNGYTEDHIGIPYVGINEYVDGKKIKTFSRVELEELLTCAGFNSTDFYYPYPDYKLPTEIYSDSYLPLMGDLRNVDEWSCDQRISFNMITMWDSICREKVFPAFSNSFLVFAKISEDDGKKIIYEKSNYGRIQKYAVNTLIESQGKKIHIIKCPSYQEAELHIKNIINNERKWNCSNPTIPCRGGKLFNNNYIGEYIDGIRLDNYLYQYRYDSLKFVELLKDIIENYYFSNTKTIPFQETKEFIDMFGTYSISGELSNEVTNIDLVFHNIFIVDNNVLLCTDCEWIVDFPVPYKYVAWRAISQFYYGYYDVFSNVICLQRVYEEMGISEREQNMFESMERNFHDYVLNQKLDSVLKKYKKRIDEHTGKKYNTNYG